MRLLVSGQSGQVARSLTALARPGLDIVALGRPTLDITSRASLDRAIREHRPDAVVSAAAYTAVDKAESDEAAAFAVNRDGAGNLAAAAAAAGLPVIHLSTDYVFSGEKGAPYTESDPPGPRSVYGRSKLAGEAAVGAANACSAILRTAWVYSAFGGNFLKTMLRLAAERDVVRVVADQRGTPTYAPDIAQAILAVAGRMLREPRAESWRGVFHMVSSGETTWAGFAAEIFRQSAARGGVSARVQAIGTAGYPTAAARPPDSRLDTTRFRSVFRHETPDWQNSVSLCLEALESRQRS